MWALLWTCADVAYYVGFIGGIILALALLSKATVGWLGGQAVDVQVLNRMVLALAMSFVGAWAALLLKSRIAQLGWSRGWITREDYENPRRRTA
jgi:hypothetical protein